MSYNYPSLLTVLGLVSLATPTVPATFQANAVRAGVAIEPSVLPSTPTTGSVAIDSADGNRFKWWDGSAWQTAGSGVAGGADTQIQYNNGGALAGSANFVYKPLTTGGAALSHTSTFTSFTGQAYYGTLLTYNMAPTVSIASTSLYALRVFGQMGNVGTGLSTGSTQLRGIEVLITPPTVGTWAGSIKLIRLSNTGGLITGGVLGLETDVVAGTGSVSQLIAASIYATTRKDFAGDVTELFGARIAASGSVAGNIGAVYGVRASYSLSTATATNAYGLYIFADPTGVTNAYGIYQQGAVSNYFEGTITAPNGTAAAPGLRLTSEATGLYRKGASSLGVSVAGVQAVGIEKPGAGNGGGIQFITTADADYTYLYSDRANAEMRLSAGNASSNGGHVRLYGSGHASASTGRLYGGTTLALTWASTGLTAAIAVTIPDGTAAAPGIRTTTYAHGLYSIGASSVGIAAAGVAALSITKPDGATAGGVLTLQAPSAAEAVTITNSANDSATLLSGGQASAGKCIVYGSTHATKPAYVEFTRGATVSAYFNGSGGLTLNSVAYGAANCLVLDSAGTANFRLMRELSSSTNGGSAEIGLNVYYDSGFQKDVAGVSGGYLAFIQSAVAGETTRLSYYGIVADSTSAIERFRIHTDGVGQFFGQLRVPDGTAAAPGIRTATEASGLYRYDSTNIGIAVAGVHAVRISAAGGGTISTERVSLTGTVTTGAQIFYGMTTSGGENLNFQYQETVVGSLPADVWALRLGGSNVRAIHVTSFDSSSLFSISAAGAVTCASTLSATSLTASGLTSGRVPFVTTGGLLTDSASLTYTDPNLTMSAAVNGSVQLLLRNTDTTGVSAQTQITVENGSSPTANLVNGAYGAGRTGSQLGASRANAAYLYTTAAATSALLIGHTGCSAPVIIGSNNAAICTFATTGITAAQPFSATSLTASGLTSGRVPFVTTGGLLTDSAFFTVATGGVLTTGGLVSSVTGLQPATLTLRVDTDGQGKYIDLVATGGTKYNWRFGAQINVNDGWEITPSTAAGGTTYSTPAIQVLAAAGGAITLARPVTCTGTVTVPNGTAAAPGLRLTGEAHGLYRVNALELGVSVAGVLSTRFGGANGSTLGGQILLSTPSATEAGFVGISASDAYAIYGAGTGAANAGQTRAYGSTHATKANYVEFTRGATVSAFFDGSGILTLNNTTDATTTADGSQRLAGGLSILKSIVSVASAVGAHYWGPAATDGTVRAYGNGAGAFIVEARVSGSYVEIGRFTV